MSGEASALIHREARAAVWVAYYGDWSGFAFFSQEVQALRYAVKHSMQVVHVPFGVDVRDYVREGAS